MNRLGKCFDRFLDVFDFVMPFSFEGTPLFKRRTHKTRDILKAN